MRPSTGEGRYHRMSKTDDKPFNTDGRTHTPANTVAASEAVFGCNVPQYTSHQFSLVHNTLTHRKKLVWLMCLFQATFKENVSFEIPSVAPRERCSNANWENGPEGGI